MQFFDINGAKQALDHRNAIEFIAVDGSGKSQHWPVVFASGDHNGQKNRFADTIVNKMKPVFTNRAGSRMTQIQLSYSLTRYPLKLKHNVVFVTQKNKLPDFGFVCRSKYKQKK